MKTFRVYFSDGNQKLYEAKNILVVMQVISLSTMKGSYSVDDVTKVEEVREND